nr:DMT family transporter [Coraliomargarita akajimensis]
MCGLLWGSAFPGIKLIYQHWHATGITAGLTDRFLLAGLRFTVAGLMLSRFILKTGPAWKQPQTRRGLLLLSCFQIILQYALFYTALSIASGTLASLLVGTGSFLLVIFSALLRRSPWPSKPQWQALSLGAIGVAIAVYAPGAGTGNPIAGTALCLLAYSMGAIALIIFKDLSGTVSARGATGIALLLGGTCLTLLGSPSIPQISQLFDLYVIGISLWLAFVSAAGFSLYNYLSTRIPIHMLATYRFLIPICGMIESLLILDTESAGWGLIVGAILVIISMILVQQNSRQSKT